jgi:hypothetical protein
MESKMRKIMFAINMLWGVLTSLLGFFVACTTLISTQAQAVPYSAVFFIALGFVIALPGLKELRRQILSLNAKKSG